MQSHNGKYRNSVLVAAELSITTCRPGRQEREGILGPGRRESCRGGCLVGLAKVRVFKVD